MTVKDYPITRGDAEWRRMLTPAQYYVMRSHGTEAPGSCALLAEKRPGRFAVGAIFRFIELPFVPGPMPDTFVAFAFGEQFQMHRIVVQFENKLRHGGVSDTKLLPINAVVRLCFAKLRQHPMAQFFHRNRFALRPKTQQFGWWRVAQQIEFCARERECGTT